MGVQGRPDEQQAWASHRRPHENTTTWTPEAPSSPAREVEGAPAPMAATSVRLRASQELLQPKDWSSSHGASPAVVQGMEMEQMGSGTRTYYPAATWSPRPEHLPVGATLPSAGAVAVQEAIPPHSPGSTAAAVAAAVAAVARGGLTSYPQPTLDHHQATTVLHAAGCPAAHQLPQQVQSSKPPSRPGSRAASRPASRATSRATSRPASRSASRSGSRSASRSASRSGHRSGYSSPGSDLR